MVLESPEALKGFLEILYRRNKPGKSLGKAYDIYDDLFTDWLETNAEKIYELYRKLQVAHEVPEEYAARMAYLLWVVHRGENPMHAPHVRVLGRGHARFFYDYLEKAGFDVARLRREHRNHVPAGVLLENVPDHGLGPHVLERRFTYPRGSKP
ncbi:MAG: hypothetical protein PWP76_272 [Candidatus Diapherotrites archaeon]|nr:hypothetical protein [Candidatus Diapherotrites archaeon]MDN5366741.1 hypothetical protein [Candidatus Diapherotrites archaeon]